MSTMFDHLPDMTNTEINQLARNRFVPYDIQMWIAQNGNIQSRYYLADNPNLSEEVIDFLMSGKSALVKGMMVRAGHIKDPEDIRTIYEEVKRRDTRNEWRLTTFFVSRPGCYGNPPVEIPDTPQDVIEDVFDLCFDRFLNLDSGGYYLHRMVVHSKVTPKMAILCSQQTRNTRLQRLGFQALAELNSKK